MNHGEIRTPIVTGTASAGFGATAIIQQSDTVDTHGAALVPLVKAILADPLSIRALSDRVYTLMQEDLRIQQERSRGFGRRL